MWKIIPQQKIFSYNIFRKKEKRAGDSLKLDFSGKIYGILFAFN